MSEDEDGETVDNSEAVSSDAPQTDGSSGKSIEETDTALRRLRRIKRVKIGVSVLVAVGISVGAILITGFSLGEVFRNLSDWGQFVESFLAPDFVDFSKYTRTRQIHSDGSLLDIFTLQFESFFSIFRPIVETVIRPITIIESFSSGQNLIGASVTTLSIGVAGTAVGLPLALLFGVFGSERVTPFPFNFIFRGVMSTIRAVPALVWVLIYIPLVGINPAGAFLAVATDTIGNLGRLFAEELEEVEDGPIEAIRSTGASKSQTVTFGMLSQVRNGFIAWTLYVVEINTRIAISLGVVGAGGLGQVIRTDIRQFQFGEAAAGIFVVILLVITVEITSTRIRSRLRPGETSSRRGFFEALRDLFDGDKWLGRVRPGK